MGNPDHIGQTLDDKYRIERELGRGGMGTVYLATHLGTERPVAVKIISPQYMQRTEFVERFRREARAAGRLRHPNVVNVTDFGFAETPDGRVAYLVMEYLDGCTLGEILEEEKNLPVGWTLDILDQVCSAVHEAHNQGIIHRDLKPDNIWLEPNLRGGYTVKVLDFGIAKLEEAMGHETRSTDELMSSYRPARATQAIDIGSSATRSERGPHTIVGEAATIAIAPENGTAAAEAGTLIQDVPGSESSTAVFTESATLASDPEVEGTRLESGSSKGGSGSRALDLQTSTGSDLTRVGAVLGTPLYMSPEQCRGEKLDPRSDIYSIGIIAYQMLSGSTPFAGDYKDVMESHKTLEPSPLRAKKARKKMRRAIHRALSKDPADRPVSAEAFASELRARSEGLFGLLRRALVIYSEHLPKFLILTTFFSLPIIVMTLALITVAFLSVSGTISDTTADISAAIVGILLSLASVFCSYLIFGTISWVVIQYLAMPLRPVRVRPALREARKKWKTFAGTGLFNTFMIFVVGLLACVVGFVAGLLLSLLSVPFAGWSKGQFIFAAVVAVSLGAIAVVVAHLIWALVSPVVMMENLRGRTAMSRSRALVKRSLWTTLGATLINIMIPAVLAGAISFFINVTAKAFDPKLSTAPPIKIGKVETTEPAKPAEGQPESAEPQKTTTYGINFGDSDAEPSDADKNMRTRVMKTFLQSLNQVVWLPIQILVVSFSAIVVALLYMKTRLSGGETMVDLMERFEDNDGPRRKWRERVRQRLIQSGRVTSKS
ncbi:MAG: protein kinase [Acidobacteriota bacterium]